MTNLQNPLLVWLDTQRMIVRGLLTSFMLLRLVSMSCDVKQVLFV